MLDWLKEILGDGYTEEIDKKVSAEIGKGFVSKTDFNTKNETLKAAQEQLSKANETIAGFKAMDVEGIKKAADDYKAKFEQAQKDAEQKTQALQFDFALSNALANAKAKNAKAVKALLDMDALKLNGDEIIGLKEQLERVKAENSYLFESDKKTPEVVRPTGGVAPTQTTEEAFGKMGYLARLALKRSNPNLYQELTEKEQ